MNTRARVEPLALLALVVVGGVIRFIVSQQDLLADELATAWVVSTGGVWDVIKTVTTTAEISPPLSFSLSWLTSRLGGTPELLRLPALLAGIATIPLTYAIGVRTVSRHAALLAAALTALSPFMIYYSAEARGYGVAMALVLASTLALLKSIDDGGARWWAVYGLAVCLAAYTHYTVVFALAVQFAWALWAHPASRKALLLATGGAMLLYLPWLPSVRGDLDSPTTKILNDLTPFNLQAVRFSTSHWAIGYPYRVPGTGLRDLPGTLALVMLGGAVLLGVVGLFTRRSGLGARLTARRGGPILIVALALATPLGAALQSAVGSNVYGTRSLATSWPYLALAVAGLITSGRPALRTVAAALAALAFVQGGAKMLTTEFRRPQFGELAAFVNERGEGVVIDVAYLTPGPLSNLDIEGSTPEVPVFRLAIPEVRDRPFDLTMSPPDPADVATRAAAAAGDGPVIIITTQPPPPLVDAFVDLLPGEWELTESKKVGGVFAIQAMVYEQVTPP